MVKLLSHKILDKRAKPILLVFGGILLVGGLIGFMVGIICLAMCGNGAPIGMVRTITPVYQGVIRWDQVLENIELCGVVPGTLMGTSCPAPIAYSAFPITRIPV